MRVPVLSFVAPALAGCLLASSVWAAPQPVPQPFPRPDRPSSPVAPPRPADAPPDEPAPVVPAEPSPAAPQAAGTPDEGTLVFPVYPGAQFITSYDAGSGQRYYLFGSLAPYAQLVAYYRTVLKTRGEQVYDPPTAVHMFEVGRFREQTMAFPPGVTIKDYSGVGGGGYLVPQPGAAPLRYPSIIQIVPPPAPGR